MQLNVHNHIKKYHDEKIKLPENKKQELREKRNISRDNIKKKDLLGNPKFYGQGSYSMNTLIQDDKNDYDIDDGIYFTLSESDMPTPHTIKERVRKAVHSNLFKEPPKNKKNCVRVTYNEGYHIDLPCYKVLNSGSTDYSYKLATENGWITSDPKYITDWFNEKCKKYGNEPEGQLKRIVRYLKKINKSRSSWAKSGKKGPSGLLITILAVNHFDPNMDRDDFAIYNTISNIINRYSDSIFEYKIIHPFTKENLYIIESSKVDRFIERLKKIKNDLNNIINSNNEVEVLKVWDTIFNTDYLITQNKTGGECLKHVQPLDYRISINPNIQIEIDLKYKDKYWHKIKSHDNHFKHNQNAEIKFQLNYKKGNIPQEAIVKIQIVNTGQEARNKNDLRGEFIVLKKSKQYQHTENLEFLGVHWVQIFIIYKNECIAKTKKLFVEKQIIQ